VALFRVLVAWRRSHILHLDLLNSLNPLRLQRTQTPPSIQTILPHLGTFSARLEPRTAFLSWPRLSPSLFSLDVFDPLFNTFSPSLPPSTPSSLPALSVHCSAIS